MPEGIIAESYACPSPERCWCLGNETTGNSTLKKMFEKCEAKTTISLEKGYVRPRFGGERDIVKLREERPLRWVEYPGSGTRICQVGELKGILD